VQIKSSWTYILDALNKFVDQSCTSLFEIWSRTEETPCDPIALELMVCWELELCGGGIGEAPMVATAP
jgi:hypothetical protein